VARELSDFAGAGEDAKSRASIQRIGGFGGAVGIEGTPFAAHRVSGPVGRLRLNLEAHFVARLETQ
jgi:hypothetical protein